MDAARRCLAASRRLGYCMRRSSTLLARKELRNAQRAIDDSRRVINGVILRDLASWARSPALEHIGAHVVTAPISRVGGTPPERYLLAQTEQLDVATKQDFRRVTPTTENATPAVKVSKLDAAKDIDFLLDFHAQHWELKKYVFLATVTAATQSRSSAATTQIATAPTSQVGCTSPERRLNTMETEDTLTTSLRKLLPKQGTIGKDLQGWKIGLNSWMWNSKSGKAPLHERVEKLAAWGWFLVEDELAIHSGEQVEKVSYSGGGRACQTGPHGSAPQGEAYGKEKDKIDLGAGGGKLLPKRSLRPQLSDASTATCSTSERRAKATRQRPVSARGSQTVRKNFYNSLWKKGLYDFWGKVIEQAMENHADMTLSHLHLDSGYETGSENLLTAACRDLNLKDLLDNELVTWIYKHHIVNLIIRDKVQAEIFLRAIHLDLVPFPSEEQIDAAVEAIGLPSGSLRDYPIKDIFDIDFSPLGYDAQEDSVEDLLEATREYCGHDDERLLHHHYQQMAGIRNSDLLGFYVPREERFVVADDGAFEGIGEYDNLGDLERREMASEIAFMNSRY
eukprot:TRINITY_DN20889_c0_g3_i1.p1 TRINITY_DN20889_c0_g3~~TRINITY_DN20889_c0_g3_i1.p1  ORF type:complete len:604 (+),score=113.44 TRINITY_DN20889_c0_g3_i1:120-1814(+)